MNIPYQLIDVLQTIAILFVAFTAMLLLALIPVVIEKYKSLRLHKSLRKLTKYSPRHGL